MLPTEAVESAEVDKDSGAGRAVVRTAEGTGDEGLPWFQSMIEGSKLGNMKRTMGERRNRDGSVRIEWEVVEWTGDDGAPEGEVLQPNGKRKLGDYVDEDSRMVGTQ